MNKESKATIAYIVGKLISKKNTSSIYDYEQAKHINISGEVNEKNVNIYNYDKGCHYSGSNSGSNYSI